jgi:hypothetical protein
MFYNKLLVNVEPNFFISLGLGISETALETICK